MNAGSSASDLTQDILDKESTDILDQLEEAKDGEAVETRLHTDQQVIARVTDGIYRQPASAFRELIANAYDADATTVTIKTDAPRFKRITIEDDGNGMGREALINLLHHIGGSAKRTAKAAPFGISKEGNPLLSPGGRKLIGKIGIGLFSVSQLTRGFHIITKVKGAAERLMASVVMKQFDGTTPGTDYESGIVKIWKEAAPDVEAHGTTIVLDNIRESARLTLSSATLWESLRQAHENEPDSVQHLPTPKYFIGSATVKDEVEVVSQIPGKESQSLPWSADDDGLTKFRKLVQAVWSEADQGNSNPKLDHIFDVYLQVVWQLSLSVPLSYIEKHPFDEEFAGWERVFTVSNRQKTSPGEVPMSDFDTPRSKLALEDTAEQGAFTVNFDGIELRRPLKFKGLPKSNSRMEKPLMFFGRCEEPFTKQPEAFSSGPLKFEAYLMWAPKVLPDDHRGVLIRINGASGTLFDTSFMKYQTAESVRLRQISCEIFVEQGLEAALNIDRESLNTAHPHTVFLSRWLHNALRQLTSTQKRLAAGVRTEQRAEEHGEELERIEKIVEAVRRQVVGEETDSAQTVVIGTPNLENSSADFVIAESALAQRDVSRDTQTHRMRQATIRKQTEAIANILAAYGLLNNLDTEQRATLIAAIYEILNDTEPVNE